MPLRHPFALLALAAGLATGSAHAAAILGTPQNLFVGISTRSVAINGSVGIAATVDLTAPGIHFTGSAPAPAGVTIPGTTTQAETVAQTTSQFLLSSGTQYAINAGFFDPCCTAANEGKNIEGLAVSNGIVISPIQSDRDASLVIYNTGLASIGLVTTLPANVADAFTGSDILVSGGRNVAPTASNSFNDANPRTAVGLSQDGKTLYLLTVDGRQTGYSVGTSLVETGDLLLALGAYTGLNLDGGGSTAAVAAIGAGGATVLNRPSGGTQRYDAGNLGVYALALPVPEPGTILLLVGPMATLLIRRKHR